MAGSCEHGNEPSDLMKVAISCIAERLLASQEGHCTMVLVG